ncbi:hypothetical protein [Salsipaludibacter albus]|uniref:hypothetical protein n=1 Tax=Salsipaludibacter albus TaxID=2849650 RepID=UPI001EE3F07A|nr:hypothetical protein [Salsipaludibacter albus]MBY5162281.1 hypothetical protein [Salsipaludibacter albus]
MGNIPILLIQVSMATLAYALLYAWYVRPRLARLPLLLAVQPLLFVQMFRFTGLTLIAEGQVDPSLPTDLLAQASSGDLASALLALVALLLARAGSSATVPLLWVLTAVGLLDFANVGRIALETNLLEFDLGAMWLALSWYVPAVLIAHVAIIDQLLASRASRPIIASE